MNEDTWRWVIAVGLVAYIATLVGLTIALAGE